MQLCRFDNDRLGLVEGDAVRDVTPALESLPRHAWPLPRFDPLIANLAAIRLRIDSLCASAPKRPLSGVKLLSPVANPGKILAAPVNYKKHLEEVLEDPAIHHQKQDSWNGTRHGQGRHMFFETVPRKHRSPGSG